MSAICRSKPPLWVALCLAALLSACQAPTASITSTPAPPTPTLVPASPTPVPAVARVNGEIVPLAFYQSEVARYEAANQSLGIELATLGNYRAQILEALIDQALLVQGARAQGRDVGPQAVQARLDALVADIGGNEAMGQWLAANGYTIPELEWTLHQTMLADEMIDLITGPISGSAEHVHARHILVDNQELAEQLRAELIDGADFGDLAAEYSLDLSTRIGGGDLGWISRGTLTLPEVERAALELGEGEISPIVESSLGFHVIEVLSRELRPLGEQARGNIHRQAVQDWLLGRRETVEIERLIEP